MNTRELVQQSIFEAADLNKGLLGLEIELLIREDVAYAPQGNDASSLAALLKSTGFGRKSDESVEGRMGSLESYYTPIEIYSVKPTQWADLAPRLQRLLAWLKHEDLVHIRPSGELGHVVDPPKPEHHPVRLARGRTTSNFSGGTHLHFDVDTWFKNGYHAQRFVQHYNYYIRILLQGAVPKPRYPVGAPNFRGNYYANTEELPYGEESPLPSWSGRDYFSSMYNADSLYSQLRYSALNVVPAVDRGDIEFRFLHGTLNFATIAGWFQAIAEMIAHADKSEGTPSGEFSDYAQAEAPDTAAFLSKHQQAYLRSKDPTKLQQNRPKAIDKIKRQFPRGRLYRLRRQHDKVINAANQMLNDPSADWHAKCDMKDRLRDIKNRWVTIGRIPNAEVNKRVAELTSLISNFRRDTI